MKTFRRISALLLALLLTALYGCGDNTPIDTDPSSSAQTDSGQSGTSDEQTGESDKSAYVNPVFSVPGGLYSSAASLSLSLPDNAPNGAYITYTTDGGEPSADGNKYASELSVANGNTVAVRAACFSSDGVQLGRIKTNTYIYSKSASATLVVSLVASDDNLYGENGIITNSSQSGTAWERPCHVEIFDAGGNELISQDAGIRVFGGSSRGLPQKSFRVVARKDGYYDELKYNGSGSFDCALFDGRRVVSGDSAGTILARYDRFILRNGGNDSIQATAADPLRMTLTRDAVANAFMAQYAPNVATQTSRFAVVYLNGEYYGILDMKEDVNDDYMQNVYGLDKTKITVIKSELDTTRHCSEHSSGGQCRFCNVWFYYEVDDGEPTELDEYTAMCKAALKAYEGSAEQRAAGYTELCREIDINNFMQYAAVSLYCCNTDWPHNNVRVWRYTGEAADGNAYSDGKWRFTTRDMDFSFGRYISSDILPELYTLADCDNVNFTLGNYKTGKYVYDGNYPDSLYVQGLLALCLTDSGFRADFKALCDTLCSEEAATFLKNTMNAYSAQISGQMSEFISYLKGTISSKYKLSVWKANAEEMLTWADSRPAYFSQYINKTLKNFN